MLNRPVLLLLLQVLILGVSTVSALCPYHMLWLPGSPHKLSDDHPALQGRTRSLLSKESKYIGAGSCTYINPFSKTEDCVQYTGADWSVESAKETCTVTGPMPGVSDAKYSKGLCKGYDSEEFAGVCVNKGGFGKERETVFLSGPSNPLTTCASMAAACETFGGGKFDVSGGECDKSEGKEKKKKGKEAKTTDACQLSPGISGGAHMHIDSFWNEECENQDNEYAMPLRWAADTQSIMIQKGDRTVGRVYYDLENNRKRSDTWYVGEDTGSSALNGRNTTFLHDHGSLITLDWNTGVCVQLQSPVGNLRANWVVDNHGAGTMSQYLGSAYVLHGDRYKSVKQWRKTEPLENAFMIQSYDDESVWETAEGRKRPILTRQTPGGPGQGDTVELYFNHTTEYDDSVFDILDGIECTPLIANSNKKGPRIFLNSDSSLHLDSGLVRVECEDCGLIYTDPGADQEKEKPDTDADPATKTKTDAKSFSGSEVIRDEGKLELVWEYSAKKETFIFSLKSEQPVGWLSIAFPEFACAMVPADAVIGISGKGSGNPKISAYRMTVATVDGVAVDNGQKLEDGTLEDVDGMQTLTFVRKANNGGQVVLDPSGPINVNWATGQSRSLGHHGVDGRGCITITGDKN